MPTLTALQQERRAAIAEAGQIKTRCEAAGRVTPDDKAEFDRLHARAADLAAQIKAAEAAAVPDAATAAARQAAAEATLDRPVALPTGVAVGAVRGRPVVVGPGTPAAHRAADAYRARFADYLRGGPEAGVTTDPATGGWAIAPPQFSLGLIKGLETDGWFRRLANVLPPTTAPKVTRAARTSQTAAVVWAEMLPFYDPANDPKFGKFTLTPHWMSLEFVLSYDSANRADAADAVTAELVAAGGAAEERAFVAGDGVGRPVGLFCPSDGGIPTAFDVAGDPTDIGTFTDVRLSLRSPYLRSPSLRWVMHPTALKVVARLKDAAGAPLLTPARRAGDPDAIGGVAVELTDDAPAGSGPSGTYVSGDYFAVIGDLSMYDIQDGLDFGVTRHAEAGDSYKSRVRYIARRKVDGCPRVAEAFRRLRVA